MASKLSASGGRRQAGSPDVGSALRHVQGAAHGFVIAAALLVSQPGSAAPGASPWTGGAEAEARLLALGPGAGDPAVREAAVELRLKPGYLTYWRQPGEAGLPPTFTTAGSENIAAVQVDFPAPRVLEEGGAKLFGYAGGVTFPLHLRLRDPARPATLAVELDYAVCATICLPGKASLRLVLPADTSPEASTIIAAAQAAVPRAAAPGAAGPLAIDAVARDGSAARMTLRVTARGSRQATLFAEAPEGWFLDAGAPAVDADGRLVFPVAVLDRPSAPPAGPVDLRLTLVDPGGAIDVPVSVDAAALTP